MANHKKVMVFLLASLMLAGCSTSNTNYKPSNENKVSAKDANNSTENNNDKKEMPKGITVNKIKFQVLSEAETPQNVVNSIKTMKANRGFIVYDYNDYYYVTVFSGKKNTGGYGIKVISVEDNEGKTNITAQETRPGKGSLTTQVITYPYTTIKITGVTPNISVINTEGENFSKILQDGEIY